MGPAAILSVLVQAEGIAETNRKLRNIQDSSEKASKSTDKLESRFSRLDNTVGDFNRTITATGNVMKLVKFPALIAGAGLAAQAIGALGAGVAGLAGALGPLVGLAGAGAAGLTALAQAGGVAALAFMGVGEALKEQLTNHAKVAKAATGSAAQQESAAKAIRAAHEGVRSAMQQVTAAQRTLTDAQYQEKQAAAAVTDAHKAQKEALAALAPAQQAATRAIQDAQSALAHAYLDEKSAVFGLIDAQNQLNALLKPADALTVADAQDQVSDSLRQQTQATLSLKNAQDQYNAIVKSGTATDVQKAQAALDLANAQNAIGDAARGAQHAQENLDKLLSPPDAYAVAKAQQAVADAQQGVSDATRNRARQEVDTNAVVKAGVNGSTQVIAAQKAIADANDNAVKAQHALVDAHRATIDAGRGVKDAMHGVQVALQAAKDAQDSAKTSAAGLAAGAVDLNAKFKALPPATQAFVKQLVALKPKFDELRSVAAQGLLPGVGTAINSAMRNFGPLRTVVDVTAQAMGNLAVKAGKLVGSGGFGKDLETVGRRNATIITHVGNAAISLADAFRHVVVVAGPLTSWLAQLVEQGAKFIDTQVKVGRESGKMAAFFERTRVVLTILGHVVRDFGVGLFNVFSGGVPLGNNLLELLEKLAAKFRSWTESVSGKNQIAAYFQNAKGPLLETFGLIGDIAGALLRISTGKGATPLIAQLRTLVPIFEQVVTNTTAAFGPALIDALGNVLRLFGQIAGSNGPLIQMVRLIGLIAGGLADLLGSTPALRSMTTSFIGLYGAAKALSFVFGPLIAGAKVLEAALIGQTVATNLATGATIKERIAMVATAAAMYVSRAATIAMTVATVALDAALAILTSPITLVILGIAALAAGLIYAYKHSETFRKIVNAMWATLKVVAAWMVTFGAAAFTAVGNAAKVAWTTVDTVTRTVWGGLKAFLGGIWTGLQTTATTVWDGIKTVILTPIRGIRDALSGKDGIWSQIHDGAIAAWDKIKTGVANFAGDIKDGVIKAFQGAVNAVVDFVNHIIDVVNLIPGVPNIKHIGHVGGGGGGKPAAQKNLGGSGHLAKGGMVPGSGYGDKVPLHIGGRLSAMVEPGELVSVANRNATAALMNVNKAVPRYADGGVLSGFRKAIGDIKPPAKANLALWEAGIVESGLRNLTGGDRDSRGALQIRDSTARGMGLNNMSPYASAVAFLTQGFWGKGGADILAIQNPKQSAGWVAQNTQGSAYPGRYDQVMSQALNYVKGYKGSVGGSGVGGALGDVVSALNPLDLIKKLPGVGDLPDFLKGTGKYVLDKVGDYIKNTVASILPGGGETSNKGLVPQVKRALAFARGHGWHGSVNSGFRTYEEQAILYNRYLRGGNIAAKPGTSSHEKGQAVDVSDIPGFASAMAIAPANAKLLSLVPGDPVHFSVSGHARGGVVGGGGLPFLGSYHTGGVAPREGFAHVSAGERMTPAGSGPLVHIEHAEFGSQIDVNSFAAKLGFKIATA